MKILLVDDHALFRAGLRMLLKTICKDAMVLEAYTLVEAISLATSHPDIELCLLDLYLKSDNGLNGLTTLKQSMAGMSIVVVSSTEDGATIRKCIEAGAMSFIPKSVTPDVLTDALQHVLKGSVYLPQQVLTTDHKNPISVPVLSGRQLDVLRCLSRGLPNKQIARELNLSDHTVKEYIGIMFKTLGVHNRTEAVITAGRLRLLENTL